MDAQGIALIIAAFFTGVASVIAAWKSAQAARLSQATDDKTAKVQTAIGPANGENVTALVHRLVEFEEYTHKRNHDMLNMLALLNWRTEMMCNQLELRAQPTEQEMRPYREGLFNE